MSHIDEIVRMAEKHEQAALDVIDRGKRDGFDPTAAALEEANIARILRQAASEMRHMRPAQMQDYAHRLKFALWKRTDDSPDVDEYREDPL